MSSEQQQIADAIREWDESGGAYRLAYAAVEPFLVAAERAGYERCKQDASAAIKETRAAYGDRNSGEWFQRDALAAVAALDATQQPETGGTP